MHVWAARSLLAPKNCRPSLHLTFLGAVASVGTVNRHQFEYVEVDLDVVFLLVHSGWADEGGGTVLGVFATYEAAYANRHRRDKDEEDEVEIREIEVG